jgi:hypothetical protein
LPTFSEIDKSNPKNKTILNMLSLLLLVVSIDDFISKHGHKKQNKKEVYNPSY